MITHVNQPIPNGVRGRRVTSTIFVRLSFVPVRRSRLIEYAIVGMRLNADKAADELKPPLLQIPDARSRVLGVGRGSSFSFGMPDGAARLAADRVVGLAEDRRDQLLVLRNFCARRPPIVSAT